MLFYVQMRWVHEGRLTLDELWEVEEKETEHAQETIDSGLVKAIYKVAAQKRVIAIVDVESIEELDRTAMGRLPMREYLEFSGWAFAGLYRIRRRCQREVQSINAKSTEN